MILYIWRHPKLMNIDGLCIGQTDVDVDRRKLKRLANKVQRFVRAHQLPKVIWVSPLQRSLKVGQILARRGFEYRVAPELAEINFGAWDSQPWSQIPKQEIDNWCDNFSDFAPKQGESLQQLFDRTETWLNKRIDERNSAPILAVGHAGWINAAKLISADKETPNLAIDWPRSVNYQSRNRLEF